MTLTLSSVGNPDYGQYYGKNVLSPPQRVKVRNFAEASEFCRAYIAKYDLGAGNWTDAIIRQGRKGIGRVTALEIAPTVDEEQVADIFVRINSEGVRLNQADFILTLMSVFWDEGRKALENFCRQSRQAPSLGSPATAFNHFIQPDPDQLLRVAVALGFGRGRLKSVYQVLRGKDLETGEFSTDRRDKQFTTLQIAQADALNLTYWHQFLSSLIGCGFRSAEMISSQTALLYAYAFYLLGRKRFAVPEHQLQRLIGRWFFAASLTGRYTSSPETIMDGDLNRLKEVSDAAGFAAVIEGIMASELTNDFWTVTLPSNLDSSSARNPELFAYTAAQNRLGAPVLFSHKKVSELLDPAIKTKKKSLERHHLFPRAWLERQGVEDLKRINQLANFALLEWPDNIEISDRPPTEYVPNIRSRFAPDDWKRMHEYHALPESWHEMSYDKFLIERRKLMAAIIRRGFESLNPTALIKAAEASTLPPTAPEDTESWKAALANPQPVGKNNKHGESGGDTVSSEPGRYELRRRYWSAFKDRLIAQGSSLQAPQPPTDMQLRFPRLYAIRAHQLEADVDTAKRQLEAAGYNSAAAAALAPGVVEKARRTRVELEFQNGRQPSQDEVDEMVFAQQKVTSRLP